MILLPTHDPGFLSQTYVKDLRLIADKFTGDPAQPWRQPVNLHANPHYHELKEGSFQLILTLNIQLNHRDQESKAEIALEQSGIFILPPMAPERIEAHLYSVGCSLLFGYAGVHINDVLTQAGWPPLYLLPLDFAECYQQFCQQRAAHADIQQPFIIQASA